VLHGDHVLVDADPLNNRLRFEVIERGAMIAPAAETATAV